VTDRDPSSIYDFDPEWGEPVDARLSRPVMVVALEGWVDAGMGASAAIVELLTTSPTTTVASFDTERLIDQRARRPIVRLEDGVTTELTWPAIRIVAGKDRVGADILYLTGPEPDFRWPTFIDAVVGLVGELKVRTVVGLGAFPAPTPHTRPVRLATTVPPQSVELAGRVGTVHGTLEVPAGVQAALELSLGNAGIPAIGLWARVPHYVSAMPYPEASAALIEGLSAVTGAVLDSSSLRSAAQVSRRQVDELIGANPEHLEMVRRLEAALDSEEEAPPALDVDVPTGDEIAAELEQFLRGEGH
jgi:predicted ATP-grasp superfamily ATP-dependent carboligase